MNGISIKSFIVIMLVCVASICPLQAGAEIITDTISVYRFHSSAPIREISEKTYKASIRNGQVVKGAFLEEDNNFQYGKDYPTNRLYKFSVDGHLIEMRPYDSPTHTANVTNYNYNSNGTIQNITTTYTFSDVGVKKAISRYIYDEKNHIIGSTNYNIFGSLTNKGTYKYNVNGDIINETIVDGNGDFEKKASNTYTYHPNGGVKTISSTEKDFSMDEIKTIKKEFDEEGRLLRSIEKMPWGTLDKVFSYNAAGHIEKLYYLECPFKDGTETYEYDESNRLVKKTISYKDNSGTVIHYLYGKMIADEIPDSISNYDSMIFLNGLAYRIKKSGNEYTYEYTLDNQGNWIKAIEYKNGVPFRMKERTISYYEQ